MPPATQHPEQTSALAKPLNELAGVGPSLQKKLARLDLHTIEDLLFTLPLRYEDRRELRPIARLRDGQREVVRARILAATEQVTARSRRRLFEVIVGDDSGQLSLKWFHYRKAWLQQRFVIGRWGYFIGEVKRFGTVREIHHPEVEFLDQQEACASLDLGRILPVYPLTEGLTQKTARTIWKNAVEKFADLAISGIPPDIARQHRLLSLAAALHQTHWPDTNENVAELENGGGEGRRTLVFDEFFFLELGLALKRRGIALEPGIPFTVSHRYTKPLAQLLPYQLTAAQRRVLGEIKADLMQPHPMNRLVQGDVGSGKTIVALMSALLAIENDCQVAVVAPTEILAAQHFQFFHHWMTQLGLQSALLSGSMPLRERRATLEGIANGSVQLVVGTHALLQEGVEFQRLGLGIIDEQHRFGVRQRGVLRRKGLAPHILVMTATPIPRTLSLTLYGDLNLSIIDELPPGRTPITTRIYSEASRMRAYELLRQHLQAGRQAYIVYPLVDESEKLDLQAATVGARRLQEEVFPDYRIGLLHGRQRTEEKDAVMAAFKAGQLDVLVATTVVEVGVDVANATVMLIEHAERFGLAQLHQLRGRVGRGGGQSFCLLLHSPECSAEAKRRLQVLAATSDGFRIAEADLEIRGPGEFLGTRQSGLPDLRVANLLRDGRLLEEARQAACRLASQDDFWHAAAYLQTRNTLLERWGKRLELASIG